MVYPASSGLAFFQDRLAGRFAPGFSSGRGLAADAAEGRAQGPHGAAGDPVPGPRVPPQALQAPRSHRIGGFRADARAMWAMMRGDVFGLEAEEGGFGEASKTRPGGGMIL